MCGLFGLLRSPTDRHPDRASAALTVLGALAVERGPHASGVALVFDAARAPKRPHSRMLRRRDVATPHWRVVKGCLPFPQLWRRHLDRELNRARLVIGHTRWATQGEPDQLVNASPLLIGGLIGTHNGDVDADLLRQQFNLRRLVSQTDSEAIFAALAQQQPEQILKVLAALRGRAALAWTRPGPTVQVHLARAALSPLVVAMDEQANLYWASVPAWLHTAAEVADINLRSLRLITEGTMLTATADPQMRITTRQRFLPTARPHDMLLRRAIWRGLTPAEQAADQREAHHRTVGSGRLVS